MANPLPSTSPFAQTGDLIIDAMTTGYRWTLGFDRTIDWSISGGFSGEFWTNPGIVEQYARAMLDTYSYYANVRFNYVGSYTTPTAAAQAGSEINFYTSASTVLFPSTSIWARAFFPTLSSDIGPQGYQGAAGDVVLNINSAANSLTSYDPGSAGWFVFIHEIGHALGLKHPHDDGGTGRPTLSNLGLEDLDIDWATMMSYKDDFNYNLRYYDPATPMLLDVLALQYLYGPNMNYNTGDTTYTLQANNFYITLWDAAGADTVTASNSDRGWYIYMPDDQISTLSPARVGYALPLAEEAASDPKSLYWLLGNIENATGSQFSDEIYGSVLNNRIFAQSGNDYIIGWDGNDTLDGGFGNDSVFGGIGDDIINDLSGANYLRGDEGNDSIVGGLGFDDANGNMGDDTISTGAGEDYCVGGKDNDSLSGGANYDLVYGNLGNDTCFGDDGDDIVRGGQGNDVVNGGNGADYVSGDKGDDTMTGGAGADIFHSFGDAGIDRVTDFNLSQGDRVQLDPGTVFTVSQVGADTVINMTGGGQMTLVGIQLSSLTGNWIFGA
jgi:Ca2+-binding RTX toxin-like protein